jgi:hypothetical protein
MKTDLLATLGVLAEQINALPDDAPASPAPVPAPTHLRVTNSYLVGGPLAIGIGWDAGPSGGSDTLMVKGADGSPGGPSEWTEVFSGGSSEGAHGERYTHVLESPAGQKLLFRLHYNLGADSGPDVELPVNSDEYLSPEAAPPPVPETPPSL